METIFAQLKQARESRNMSVADVAAATHINPNFLTAIEEGKTDILPQAYVRAFLREFASVVGLDPHRVMAEYDALTTRSTAAKPAAAKAREEKPPAQLQPAEDVPSSGPRRSGSTAVAAVVAVVVLGTILYWNFSRAPEQPSERSAVPKRETLTEPEMREAMPPTVPQRIDSLRLRAMTSDTVWVQIIIDSRDSLDFILYPNSTRGWTAGESFKVSVGRPEAVKFTLNNTEMGYLGSREKIVRNILIDRGTLTRLRQGK